MRKYFVIILIILGIFIGLVLLPKSLGSEKKIIFQISTGQSSAKIASNLEREGLIWWDPLFRVYLLFRRATGKLQAGCYSISPSMGINKIAKIITSGSVAKEKITIPEGFTSVQIIEKLTRTFPVKLTGNVLVNWGDYEGYLFPDTYEIPYCQNQDKIIEMMTDNFNRKTADLKITPEIVIMASLLEKELKTKEEKELASGILWKRLKVGIPLQVDAEMWTYENYGLPPKPISNPGLETILAALQPKKSAYWYYLSTPEGTTIFSKTLEEHNIARAIYLK